MEASVAVTWGSGSSEQADILVRTVADAATSGELSAVQTHRTEQWPLPGAPWTVK